ncbi:unnamed protein product [Toxocara canis]|uniref:Transposase n=1 Tax=Toxocara canis TaxID=6265 RepID=A0A183U9U1_TOXCA|nr:unnamed protein product [Toxocara canis]
MRFSAANNDEPVEVELDESTLQIHPGTMKQRNVTSGYVRAVRCVTRVENGSFTGALSAVRAYSSQTYRDVFYTW